MSFFEVEVLNEYFVFLPDMYLKATMRYPGWPWIPTRRTASRAYRFTCRS